METEAVGIVVTELGIGRLARSLNKGLAVSDGTDWEAKTLRSHPLGSTDNAGISQGR